MEDLKQLMNEMKENHRHNPKSFFRIAKALSKAQNKVKIVTGFIEKGKKITLAKGLKDIVRDLYCPTLNRLSFIVVQTAKYQNHLR